MGDYKKKYKQLTKLIKDLYPLMSDYCKEKVEGMIPELQESEDERIRRKLINALKECGFTHFNDEFTVQEALAWLEKQSEQNPTDKVKPKFNVGDWIASKLSNSGAVIYRVVNIRQIDDETYGYDLDDGTYFSGSFESEYHLWTTRDAKDGDVLVTPNNNIFIFREIHDYQHIYDHCGLYFGRFLAESACVNGTRSEELPNDYKPATKEQRDLLFQKMKESGYEWDADKKELKKIGQKSVMSDSEKAHQIAWETSKHYDPLLSKESWCEMSALDRYDTISPLIGGSFPDATISVVEHNSEKWVRVQAMGEDFIIAPRDLDDSRAFTYDSAMERLKDLGLDTFNRKQGELIEKYIDQINGKLCEIGGEPMDQYAYVSNELCNDDGSVGESYANNTWYFNGYNRLLDHTSRAYSYFRCRPCFTNQKNN